MADPCEGLALPMTTVEATEVGKVRIPEDLEGKWTVLYFYPKDDTPGCTKQACSYKDHLSDFRKLGVQIFGVSGDDLESHEAFKAKFHLNFPLLADTEHVLGQALGTWHVTENMGKTFWGNDRDTFLIGPDARIRKVWRKVNAQTTMQETYDEALRLIEAEPQSRKIG